MGNCKVRLAGRDVEIDIESFSYNFNVNILSSQVRSAMRHVPVRILPTTISFTVLWPHERLKAGVGDPNVDRHQFSALLKRHWQQMLRGNAIPIVLNYGTIIPVPPPTPVVPPTAPVSALDPVAHTLPAEWIAFASARAIKNAMLLAGHDPLSSVDVSDVAFALTAIGHNYGGQVDLSDLQVLTAFGLTAIGHNYGVTQDPADIRVLHNHGRTVAPKPADRTVPVDEYATERAYWGEWRGIITSAKSVDRRFTTIHRLQYEMILTESLLAPSSASVAAHANAQDVLFYGDRWVETIDGNESVVDLDRPDGTDGPYVHRPGLQE